MNKKLIWAAVVAILAGGIFTLRLSGRDERIIRKTFRQAVSSMEKDGAESPVTAALRADSIANSFVQNPEVQVPWGGDSLRSRQEIRSTVFQIRSMADSLRLDVSDVLLQIRPDRRSATLTGTVKASATGRGESGSRYQEFVSEWVLVEDGWRISILRAVDAIRRPDEG